MNRALPSRLTLFAVGTLSSTLFAATALSGVVAPRPAYAAPFVIVEASPLSGVEMPKGAERWNKSDSLFRGVLTALAKEKIVNLAPLGSNVEVWAWRGGNYREDRVSFTKSSVKRALTAAGYEVEEVPEYEIGGLNIFSHFDLEDMNLPFRPSNTKKSNYFRATNDAKGQTILGAWLESDDAVAIGFLPVEFKGTPKPAALPVVSGPNVILVKDFNDTMKGLPAPKMPAFPALAPKPRTVRGYVLDAGGKPIAGAEVAVYTSAGGGFRTTHKGRSNAAGLYEVPLPAGVAEIAEAKCNVAYNGVTYELPLVAAKGKSTTFNATTGYVENFTIRTAGEYGGTIRVLDGMSKGTLEVTLTPVGRLLDGSAGKTFVYRFNAADAHETYLNGIPLGRYKLTARLFDGGDELPMQVRRTFGTDAERALKESLQIDFQPGFTYSQANPGKSNSRIAHVEAMLEP